MSRISGRDPAGRKEGRKAANVTCALMVRLKWRSPPSKSSGRFRLMTALLLCLLSSENFLASLPARMAYEISELTVLGLSASCAEIPRNIVRPAILSSP